MLTKNEITALSLSPTKKDFVQIWNELLEVAGKLSERWDPTSTNESDPGIVILKALTGIADKLNYNIDKNTLEAFMPTAAQEDSMRKLCDMLGYNIKYFRSAETSVTIKYYNNDPSEEEEATIKGGLLIPKFTVITNSDKDISYFTTNQVPYYISNTTPSVTLPCMEGQIVKCEGTTDNNVITISQISNNRFYLPEAQVAENGIFVYNVSSANLGTDLVPEWAMADGTPWEKVDNLNIQARGERVFKFGYDSYESRPYIEFPSDCSELINDGLFIYYTRTSGANGNVSPRTLTQFEKPSGNDWGAVPVESFSVENTFAATTGANIETIKQAYNNFKKTIGTFETLVTCRDYMNKIYSMTDDSSRPLVSNILVTDIRNDLNRAVTICSCDGAGIFYKETPLTNITVVDTPGEPEYIDGQKITTITRVVEKEPAINYFDLVLYPFKSYSQIKNNVKDIQETYDSSFKYDLQSFNILKRDLDEKQAKTIAHNIISPEQDDIVCINNYLRLSAIIGTNTKITTEEGSLLKEVIKVALANAFNMRELDFGEEIPFESIVEVIENADSRIKVVSLNEPALYTTFSVIDSYDAYSNPVLKEYAVASEWLTEEDADASGRFEIQKDSNGNYTGGTFNTKKAKEIYNKLAVRNLLAGRLPLFKYHTTFGTSFSEGAYRATTQIAYADLPEALQSNQEWQSDNSSSAIYLLNGTTYLKKVETIDGVETVIYSKSATPKKDETAAAPEDKYPGNTIVKNSDDDNNITEIETSCKIYPDKDQAGNYTANITDVTLSTGEFIKFRAPNFVTTKTYPAYVNYHLALSKELIAGATGAQAETLFSLLNEGNSRETKWGRVLNYFGSINKKKTFKLTQKVSKVDDPTTTTRPGLVIDNPSAGSTEDTPASLLAKSGCIKLNNNGVPAIKWVNKDGAPNLTKKDLNELTINLADDSWIITNPSVFEKIQVRIDEILNGFKPFDDEWTISYEFEYVPFESNTLADWERFVRQEGKSLFGFTPAENAGNVLWRIYGDSYSIGKFILDEGAKLLPFTSTYFGTLDNLYSRLHGIYIAKDLGRDAEAYIIKNNTEYELRQNEYLYIEYTPSTTTADGTSQTQEPVKEIYGPGTIIRPSGFEEGLMDSSAYATKGHSALKNATFDTLAKEIPLYSFGANEQVEIRELSQTVLNKDLFANSSTIYVYKNFNNCPELEEIPYDGYQNGKRINSSYTLKDGEYIFYTDQNKTELAYFTSGTEVTLTGKIVLPKFEIIDLATIFDSGIQQIPWSPLSFTNNTMQEADGITFQEYQYITLGPDDTLDKLTLVSGGDCINNTWQYCKDVAYTVAGGSDSVPLNTVNVSATGDTGCGWEVSSILELVVSPNTAQVLRSTEKVKTTLTLHKTNASGVIDNEDDITVAAENQDSPLSFKANITCQSSNGKAKLSELFTNTNNAKSFELKVFSDEAPTIINTIRDTLIPYTGTVELSSKASTLTLAGYNELWSHATLDTLKTTSTKYDKAIKLSVSVLPNTYGIFSIYLDYGKTASGSKTWIELLPGTTVAADAIILFNTDPAKVTWESKDELENDINPRLVLNPGLNCIRVNTTCDLYIKTAETSNGTLYFDELRLVDSMIKVTKDDKSEYHTVHGLNLAQIGYLANTDDGRFNVFDKRARQARVAEYRATALTKLSSEEQKLNNEFYTNWKLLLKDQAKVQNVKEFLETAKAELEAMHKANDTDDVYKDNLAELFANFKDIYEDLNQELTLKEALVNNEDINSIEQQLAELLESLASSEAHGQDLLKNLGELRDTTIAGAESFSSLPSEDIIEDFETYATNDVKLISDLKLASLVEINKHYGEQLTTIAESFDQVANSETKVKLEAALNAIHKKEHTELLQQVGTLTETGQAAMSVASAEAVYAAQGNESDGVNYTDVANKLVALRDLVSYFDINALISDIEFAAEESLYTDLAQLVAQLKTLLASVDTAIVKKIDAALILVRAKTNTTKDQNIISAISAIKTDIDARISDDINNTLGEITTLIATSAAAYKQIIEDLETVEDNQVKLLAEQLTGITEERSLKVTAVADFSGTNIKVEYATLPFAEESVLAVWPNHMKVELTRLVNDFYAEIRSKVKGNNAENTLISVAQSKLITTAANVVAFEELLEQAEKFGQESIGNEARRNLINKISESISLSPELDAALKGLANINNINEVIYNITNKLLTDQDLDAIEKHQLIMSLMEELDKEIQLDTQLVNISAKLLCPSILRFENIFKGDLNDDFYTALKTFVVNARTQLLASANYNNTLGDILSKPGTINLITAKTAVEALLEKLDDAKVTELKTWLKENLDVDTTNKVITNLQQALLPSNYENSTFAKAVYALDINNNSQIILSKIEDFTLFKYLSSDIVAAYQDSSGNWFDGAGNSFKQHYTGVNWKYANDAEIEVDVKRDSDGKWYDCLTGSEIVLKNGEAWVTKTGTDLVTIESAEVELILNRLLEELTDLSDDTIVADEAYDTLCLEEQLLEEIRAIDKDRLFYYNGQIEPNIAIDFTESDAKLNTLMNPAVNYDINNVNNSFVISKLDINHLTNGLQIARSSRIS